MNAPANLPAANMAIWNALSRTDPKHTKQFKRSGGFSGTALKPIWIVQRLTEQFGPVGMGWGIGKPEFEVVPGDNREVLVYCTVECWHTSPAHTFFGVGGDKVITHIKENKQYNRPERWENDDEAFKKAFTDAVGNAFKFLGVGADIHMGQFDDSKYVQEVAREFAGGQSQEGAVGPRQTETKPKNWGGRYPTMTALKQAMHTHHAELERMAIESVMDDLDGYLASPEYKDYIATALEHAPYYLEGPRHPNAPPEFIQTFALEQKARDMIALRGNVPADMEN